MTDDAEHEDASAEYEAHHPRFIILSHGKYYITRELLEYDAAKAETGTRQEEGVRRVREEFETRVHTNSHRNAVEYDVAGPVAFQQTKH